MNGNTTIIDYEAETTFNNGKVLEMISSMFPESNIMTRLSTHLKIDNAITNIQKTNQIGEVIVHVKGSKVSVELRARYESDYTD